jgi:DNA repair exonuclease SbcCD ATPase subunit
MADTNNSTGIGLELSISDDIFKDVDRVDRAIKEMRKNAEVELKALGDAFGKIPAEGIDALIAKINSINTAISEVKPDSGLAQAIKEIAQSSNDSKSIAELSTVLQTLTATLQSGVKISTPLENVGEAAKTATTDVSALAQQMAQVANAIQASTGTMTSFIEKLNQAGLESKNVKDAISPLSKGIVDTSAISAEVQALTNGLNEMKAAAAKVVPALKQVFSNENFTLPQAKDEAAKYIEQLEAKIRDLKAQINALGQPNLFNNEEILKYEEAISKLKSDIANIKSPDFETALSDIEGKTQKLQAEFAELAKRISDNSDITITINKISALKEKIAELTQQYEVLVAKRDTAVDKKEQLSYDREIKAQAALIKSKQDEIDALERSATDKAKIDEKELARMSEKGRKSNEEYNKEIESLAKLNAARRKAFDDYQKRNDKDILVEQNRLLNEKLKLTKQLDNLDIISQKNTILGKESLTSSQLDLQSGVLARIKEIDSALQSLNEKYHTLSQAGQAAFDTRGMQYYLAWQKQLMEYEEKLTKERTKAQEIANGTNKSTLQPTSEELSVQRTLTQLYAEKLRLEQELLKVQSSVTLAGGTATSSQRQYIDFLTKSTTELQTRIDEVGKGFDKIAQNKRDNYLSEWMKSAEKNAYDLANALDRVNAAEQKSDTSKAVAAYKSKYAELQKINAALAEYERLLASGATPTTEQSNVASTMYQQRYAILADLSALEHKNIDEIATFRTQKENEANQQVIADFAAAEAEKNKLAKQTANQMVQQIRESYGGAIRSYEKLTSGKGTDDFANTYNNRARVIKELQIALANLADTEGKNKSKAEELRGAIQKLTAAQKEYEAAVKGSQYGKSSQTKQPTIETAERVAAIAQQTKSLTDLKEAYRQLQAVMSSMSINDPQWKYLNGLLQQTKASITEVKTAMGEVKSESQKTSLIAGQLGRALTGAFSVSAIKGYVEQVVQVRAQFELQRIALGAILQDTEKANEVFKQVQSMALESPFSIMQLEKATKQISAFGVEADKLKPSIKMLADISAGLGVDIDRLILVYGHIKANNALQQLHVRQFTNAGFNIAQNLADYYTELEGKMVSVAEVTDRIHKKMVTFSDVEEVLKRVTSAGGMFYDMQKKQSESIWGQMQRIKDQMDLMFNEIGQSNQGAITWALSAIRQLIKSWRDFSFIIRDAAIAFAAFGAYKYVLTPMWSLIKKFGVAIATATRNARLGYAIARTEQNAFTASLKAGTVWAKVFGTTLKSALGSTGVGLLLVALGELIQYLVTADGATQQLNEELSRIGESQRESMDESVSNYLRLAETVRDTSIAYSERENALSDLNRIYKDILPQYMLEEDYIRNNANAYRDATQSIKEYYASKEYEQKIEAIESSDNYVNAVKRMKETGKRMLDQGMFDATQTKESVDMWMETIAKELATGKIENTAESIGNRIQEVFKEHLLNPEDLGYYLEESYGKSDFTDAMQEIDKIIKAKGNLTLETLKGANAEEMWNNTLKKAPLDKVASMYQNNADRIKTLNENIKAVSESTNMDAYSKANTIRDNTRELNQLTEAQEQLKKAMSDRIFDQMNESFESAFSNVEATINSYADLKAKYEELAAIPSPTAEETAQMEQLQFQIDQSQMSIMKMTLAMSQYYDTYDPSIYGKEKKTLESLFDEYDNLIEKKERLAKTSTGSEDDKKAMADLEEQIRQTEERISSVAKKMGLELDPALISNTDNAFELEKAINQLKLDSFKQFAENSKKNLGGLLDKILQILGKVNILKNIISKFYKIAGQEDPFKDSGATTTAAQDKQAEAAKEAANALNTEQKVYDEAAKKFGVSVNKLSKFRRKDGESNINYAKRLNDTAAEAEKTQKHYESLTAEQKKEYLEVHKITEKQINDNAKLAKAQKYIAQVYDETGKNDAKSKKTSKGKDEFAEKLKNRAKALQDFYKQYETAQKKFSDTESLSKARTAFEKLFSSLGMNVNDVIAKGMDKKGLATNLDNLLSTVKQFRPKLVSEFEKYSADAHMEVDVEIQEADLNNMKNELSEMFDNYELSKTLTDLGLSIELTYAVGGKPTTLDDISDNINGIYKKALKDEKYLGSEGEKIWDDYSKKLNDITIKGLQQRIKDYKKYMLKSYSEQTQKMIEFNNTRLQMEEDFAKMRAEIESSSISDSQKSSQLQMLSNQQSRAIENLKKELEKEIAGLDWKQFQESPLFTELFTELDNKSKRVLATLRTRLDELRSSLTNLDPTQLKQLNQYYDKLKEAEIERAPFSALVKNLKEISKLRKEGWTKDKLDSSYASASIEEQQSQQQINALESQIAAIEKLLSLSDKELTTRGRVRNELQAESAALNDQLNGEKEVNSEVRNFLTFLKESLGYYNDAEISLEKELSNWKKIQEMEQRAGKIIRSSFEALGQEIDPVTDACIDIADQLMEATINTMEFAVQLQVAGVAAKSAMGIIGYILIALEAIVNVLVSISKASSKRIDKKIDSWKDKIEDLSNAYDKLSDAIEKAFSYSQYESNYESAQANLQQQINDYNEMRRLESQKKDSDTDKLREYTQAIEELKEKSEELKEQRITDLGGFGESNYRQNAEDFVSAWLDAYKETGDGLDALSDQWDEFIENLFIKQATMKKAGKLYEKAMSIIDDAIDSGVSGEDLSPYLQQAKDSVSNANTELDEYLKTLAEIFGITQSGETSISELQQGINNITEPQAAAIEAYLNSIRFYVANQNSQVAELLNLIKSQYSTTGNPVLDVVKEIRDSLDKFSTKFEKAFTQREGTWKLQVC